MRHYGMAAERASVFSIEANHPHIDPMGRLPLFFSLCLLLLACSEARQSRPPVMRAEAAFATSDQSALQVQVIDIPPGTVVEEIVLVGPAGPVRVASDMSRSTIDSGPGTITRPTLSFAVTGGSSSGIKPAVGIGWQVTGGGPSRRHRKISATIPIDDLPDYGAIPQVWHLEVRYLDVSATRRVLTLKAPARR